MRAHVHSHSCYSQTRGLFPGFDNPRTNLCCVDGPYKLYKVTEDADSVVLNEAVIRRMLQMVVA